MDDNHDEALVGEDEGKQRRVSLGKSTRSPVAVHIMIDHSWDGYWL